MGPRIIDKDEKKRLIIDSAIAVFAEKGLNNTKMADIALAAGIGKGTIYEYYKSKDEIFWESFNYFKQEMDMQLGRSVMNISDPAEKLAAIIESFMNSFEQFGKYSYIMFDFWAEGIRNRNHRVDDLLRKIYIDYREYLAAILDEGIDQGIFSQIDTKLVASSIIGALDGLILQWIIFGKDYDVKKATAEFNNMVLNGIKK